MKVNEEKNAGVQRDETVNGLKAAHTPGPWSCGDTWMVKAGPITISQDWNGTVKHQELRANARLIASAPDLLAACKGALIYLNGPAYDACEEALAKATGGQQ